MKLLKLLPRFREAEQALAALAEREDWPRANIESWQLERLNSVWAHAAGHVPHYRELARSRQLPRSFSSWREFEATVPVLFKDRVRQSPERFLSERADHGFWTLTGGSTGAPTRIFWSHRSHREMLRAKYRFHALWNIDMFDRAAFLWGRAASRPSGWRGQYELARERITDRLRTRLRISAYHLGDADLQHALRRIEKFQPSMMYGFSHAMFLLAQAAQRERFRCESLKLCILTAEPTSPHQRQAVSDGFGAPTAIEYGATECGLIAYQHPDGNLRVREDLVRVETLPRDDGRFDLVLTVLSNASFPLLRYAIGDVADAPLRAPSRGFASLKNVSGRNDDLLVTHQGHYLHSARVDAIFESSDYPAVAQYQVLQAQSGAVRVLLRLAEAQRTLNRQKLQAEFEQLLHGYPVSLEIVDSIPQLPSGKHRAVHSELSKRRFEPASP